MTMGDGSRVELVYDNGCPSLELARTVVRLALARAGGETTWTEWERGDARIPFDYRAYGSPTVLVDGRDVAPDHNGQVMSSGYCCRLYVDESGVLSSAPPVELIAAAIRAGHEPTK
jgi:hypothetical protein